MKTSVKRLITLTVPLVAAFGLLAPLEASAVPVQVVSRAALAGNDFIDWGVLGPSGTVVADPFLIQSNSGTVNATVTNTQGPAFERRDQGPTSGWNGNFAPGDRVLWTQMVVGPTMVIDFATPVQGAGAQIQANFPASPFVAFLDVYDANDNFVIAFQLAGVTNSNNDNSAIFLGVQDTAGIGRIVYGVANPLSNFDDFAINQLDLKTGGAAVVPEPGTLLLLGSGLAGLGVWGRRKFKW